MKRQFNIHKFLEDVGASYADPSHKHYRVGWVNIECPFCSGNPGYHLGFPLEGFSFNCHRCGTHSAVEVVAYFLGVSDAEAYRAMERYGGRPVKRSPVARKALKRKSRGVKYPPGTEELGERHRKYLEGRDFDPDELIERWKLKGTGHIGPYKHRIIAPIYHQGFLVSYQGRDITDRQALKYKACPKDKEVMDHNLTLYGIDLAKDDTIVIVEGIIDAWRLGPGAVATFGTGFTNAQINLLKSYSRRVVLFDSEPIAQERARELASALSAFRGETLIADLGTGDPGDLKAKEALDIMGSLRNDRH